MAKKQHRSTRVPGLYPKRDKFVWQPPMKNGARPPGIFLNTSDLSEAILMVEDLKQRETIRSIEAETADLLEEFLAAKARSRKHKGPATTRTARANLKRFITRFPQLRSIHTRGLEKWRDDLHAERKISTDEDGRILRTDLPALSVASINSYLRYAQSFTSWLVKNDYLLRNPFEKSTDLFPRTIPTRRGSACTKEERDRLIQHCEHLELKAVLFFGFHTGARRNEILNMRPHWIQQDETGRPSHLHIQPESGRDGTTPFTIKDDEARLVPLTDPLIEFIMEHHLTDRSPYLIAPDIRGGKNNYRWDFKRRWSTHVRSEGLPRVTPHTMRHTFVTLLLSAPPEKRPSLLHLERWTGDDVGTLKKNYAHLLEDREMINAAN